MCTVIRSIFAGLAMTLAAASIAKAQTAPEQAEITIGLPVTTSTFLPIYLAQEEGFFADEGLKVEIVAFRGGTDLMRGMVAGAVDVAVGALAEAFAGIEASQPIKVFYGGFNMAMFEWYSIPSIKSFEETKGARFGVTRFGSSTDFLTRYALTTRGLDPKSDVQIIQGGGSAARMAAMEAGQLDVNIFAAPEKFMAADEGYNLILRQSDIAEDYPFHVFYTMEEYLEANPNTIKAVLRAFVRGVRLAKSDKERSVRLIAEKIGVEKSYAEKTYEDFIDMVFEDGRMASEAGMDAFWKMGIENGSYTEVWSPERYLDRTYLDSFEEWKPQ